MSVMGEPIFATWAAQRATGFGGNLTVVDKVPPEMLHMVDTYWYQFAPLNPLWHGILGFVIGALGFVALMGNGMVMYIFMSTQGLRTPSNLLVVNLAFSDFGMCCTQSVPMVINCYYETWVLGALGCELYGLFGSLFGGASIWTMVFIALDRYNVIVKGLSATPLTKKTAMLRILMIWTLAVLWTIAPMFGWNRYIPEGNMTACGLDYLNKDWHSASYVVVYATFVYLTPLLTIIYSYWFIVQAVSAHEKSMREQAKKMNVASLRSSEAAQTSAECKLAKIALMTISLWFVAWTPYLVTNFVGIFGENRITPLGTIWASLFAKANAVYNPIVYGISHPKYRQALQKKFPSLVCAGDQTPHQQDDTTSQASGVTTDDKPAA
uniref:Long wavelength sensitive opsin 2 n=1 Tax=Nedyus quadrimaculatus TaxID=202049 RepID=A0A8F2P935_9CUCU|nr:long wavelength sensitive opsin 2 [Nedyus quadrimaculatus]